MWFTFEVNWIYFFVNEYTIGFGSGFGDWGEGVWKTMWISRERVGFCWWKRVWKVGEIGVRGTVDIKGRVGWAEG